MGDGGREFSCSNSVIYDLCLTATEEMFSVSVSHSKVLTISCSRLTLEVWCIALDSTVYSIRQSLFIIDLTR
jgi:hypothetical protein